MWDVVDQVEMYMALKYGMIPRPRRLQSVTLDTILYRHLGKAILWDRKDVAEEVQREKNFVKLKYIASHWDFF